MGDLALRFTEIVIDINPEIGSGWNAAMGKTLPGGCEGFAEQLLRPGGQSFDVEVETEALG